MKLADEQLRDYAIDLIVDHASDVEWLSIFECFEEWSGGKDEISEEDAARVDELIRGAKITVKLEEE